MLLVKDITKITYQDVVDFCNKQIKESVNLDYKQDFPADLEKTIAAFANTQGGVIIIGVADKDGTPKLPVSGLKYQKGLSERVTSIVLANIYPPVIPEVQVCDPVAGKTFVVIRVPQSNTDHWIQHRTELYVRTNDINKPEKLATREEVEWLRDRRRKSEELRESLYATATERYQGWLALRNLEEVPFAEATISIVPLYPSKPYKSFQEIAEIGRQKYFRVLREVYGKMKQHDVRDQSQPVQGGIANLVYSNETRSVCLYTELNQFGLLYNKMNLGKLDPKDGTKVIAFANIIWLIDAFLKTSADLYEELGYWGLVEFKFSLEKLSGVTVIIANNIQRGYQSTEPIDAKLEWHREYYVARIKDEREELLKELVKDVGWSLGWDYKTDDKVLRVIDDALRVVSRRSGGAAG